MRYPLIIALVACLAVSACDQQTPSADEKDTAAQVDINDEAVREVPVPTIVHFAARRMLKAAYEAEDKQIPTYSYHFSAYHNCYIPAGGDAHSFGYPIPGATQMTNPSKLTFTGTQYGIVLPQSDPDTTFKPSSETATLLMQLNKTTGQNDITYSEPDLVTKTSPIAPEWICHPNV